MPSRCAVPGCSETSSLHRIPPHQKFPLLHSKWLLSCRREPTKPSSEVRVCSKHFVNEDFDATKNGKIRAGAVPTQHLPFTPISIHSVDLLIDPQSSGTTYTVDLSDANIQLNINVKFGQCETRFKKSGDDAIKLKKDLGAARRISEKSRKISKLYKTRYMNMLKRRRNMKTPNEVKGLLNKARCEVHEFYQKKLKSIFTSNQIKRLISNKKTWWNSEDIVRGLAMRYRGNTYDQMVKKKFPFPTTRTLRKWTKKFQFPPGPPPQSLLQLLKSIFGRASKLKKIAVLCFDEVGIDARLAYDREEDRIYAGKSNMTVFMIRGLFDPWKQVIAYDFDGTVTVEKLNELLAALEYCGIEIRAITSDMGGKNMSLWKNLKIQITKTKDNQIHIQNTIRSPVNNQLIYFFADVPHLIKNLRNNILNKGITLECGDTLGLKDFQYMASQDKKDLSTTWKVSDRHLNLNDQQKQRVRLATELLSGTVATTFEHVLKRKRAAEFLKTVNNSFDVLNSRHLKETLPNKMAYGLSLPTQNQSLTKMTHEIATLRVGDSKALFPFQKGYLLTIKSFQELFQELKETLSIRYILAHRLNQDILENTFSCLRGIGGFNMNPTAVDAKRRLKLMMLSSTGTLSSGANVEEDPDHGAFITGQMFSKLITNTQERTTYDIELPDDALAEEYLRLQSNHEDGHEPPEKYQRLDEVCEETATHILAGYIAFKMKLSILIASEEECEKFSSLSWYKQLRARGYAIPSRLWQNQVSILNSEFLKFHGEAVSTRCGVMEGFSLALCKKYPYFNSEAVTRFCKIRTYIRMKSMNKNSAAAKLQQKKTTADKVQKLQDRWNYSKLLERANTSVKEKEEASSLESCDFTFLYDGNNFEWCNEAIEKTVSVFGHKELSSLQRTSINVTMSGLDCLLIMPTGSGKSLVYQLSACLSSGVTIVISPLISLIKDQTMDLHRLGISAVALTCGNLGSLEPIETPTSTAKLIYASPEMIAKSKRLKDYIESLYKAGHLTRFVVDEAHCILHWGKEFRSDYDSISQLKSLYPSVPMLAVSATVPKSRDRELCHSLGIPGGVVLRDPSFRENLSYEVMIVSVSEKNVTLKQLVLEKFADVPGIIYCSTIRECEVVTKFLTGAGVSAKTYHAKLTIENRNCVQEAWYTGDHNVMVATTAFGMGVNKKDCRFVIHYTCATSLINYQQETGRAGRDGEKAYSITLLTMQDVFRTLGMVCLTEGGSNNVYEILRYALSFNVCRRSMLKLYFGHEVLEAEKCTSCDNCSSQVKTTIDATIYLTEIHKILDMSKNIKEKLTAKTLVDILLGKSRKSQYNNGITFREKSRTFLEGIVMFLLAENFLCEECSITGRSNICYVVKGSRPVDHCVSYTMAA